jgi:hypothetical protein
MTLADIFRDIGNMASQALLPADETQSNHMHAQPHYPIQPLAGHAVNTGHPMAPSGQPSPVVAPPLHSANTMLPNYPATPPATPDNSLNYYSTDKQATDNYWSATRYANEAQQRPGVFTSLTGNQVLASELEHNNMQPFFGSTVKQSMPNTATESRMDSMTGAGSQYFEKQSSAPLFEPAPNHGTPYGMQCHTDFLQCRQVPSLRIANAKPFEEERVGPGLGLGYDTNEGAGGYNAGMGAREAWLPKTVDELRAPNKPKVSYPGQVLGGIGGVAARGNIGETHQKGPDRTMELGMGLAPAAGSAWGEATTSRAEYASPLSDRGLGAELQPGPAGSSVPMNDRRDQLPNPIHRIGAVDVGQQGQGPATMVGAPGTAPRYSDVAQPTARGSTLGSSFYGAASSLAREVIMPVLETFKLLKKDQATASPQQFIAPAGPEGTYKRYNDRARTTLRETTLTDEIGPASGTSLGWGIATDYGAPRRHDAHTPALIGAAGPVGMVSQEAERNAHVPSQQADLQVAYTPNGNLSLGSYYQGETRLRNTPSVQGYMGGAAPVIPSGADTRQIGSLTQTRLPEAGGPGASPSIYGDILSQLNNNPYV